MVSRLLTQFCEHSQRFMKRCDSFLTRQVHCSLQSTLKTFPINHVNMQCQCVCVHSKNISGSKYEKKSSQNAHIGEEDSLMITIK